MSTNDLPTFVCFGRFSIPEKGMECREVIWSQGRACRKCPMTKCYRHGWTKKQVDADNKKLVDQKQKESE